MIFLEHFIALIIIAIFLFNIEADLWLIHKSLKKIQDKEEKIEYKEKEELKEALKSFLDV